VTDPVATAPAGAGPVHVVGAGFAGAAAAMTLADAGVPVVLWEARAGPGGRAGGFTDAAGEAVDTGPHLLLGAYRRTRALLARLGTADRLAFQRALRVPLAVDGRLGGLACPAGLPAPFALVLGLWGLKPLGLSDRLRLLRAGHALRGAAQADGETVAAWLARIGMPPAATRLLWDPLCRAVMNLGPDEADAGPFVRALRLGLFGAPGDARLGWARGGLSDLLAPLSKHLAGRGGELRHARVAALTRGPGGVTALALAGGGRVPANRVVLAVDAFAARRLLADMGAPPALTGALGAMRPAPIVSVDLWLDRRCVPFEAGAPFFGLISGRIPPPGTTPAAEWVFDRDPVRSDGVKEPGQHVATVASAANALADLPAEEVTRRAVADLARHFPAVAGATVVRARVVKERRATVRLTPGLDRPAPGPVPGVAGVHLCGDYTDTGLPATIEGAVVSGEAAARGLLGA
jgi:hydroxysqualene dehydroxylase